jgi:hypothetical protein
MSAGSGLSLGISPGLQLSTFFCLLNMPFLFKKSFCFRSVQLLNRPPVPRQSAAIYSAVFLFFCPKRPKNPLRTGKGETGKPE